MERKSAYEYIDDVPRRERAKSMELASIHSRANVGIQTIIPPRNYISPAIAASHRLSLLDYPKFLYMPHILFFLAVSLSATIYLGFRCNDPDQPFIYTIRR